jgi:D-alanyl-lipoteichoic acid acyltransferase DltB (MBOAT superfamily)
MYTGWSGKREIVLPGNLAPIFNTILTFHFVCFCWIFFRSPSMSAVGQMFKQILLNFNLPILFQFIAGYKGVIFLMLLGYILHFIPTRVESAFRQKIIDLPFAFKAAWMVAIIVMVMQTKSAEIQPFIYFQF